jgi:GNAT superfamily N-acetyltransferase
MTDWRQLRKAVRTIFNHMEDEQISFLLRRHHDATVVACRGRQIVGYYQFYPHADSGVAWLNHFGVLADNKGHGEAVALLAFFLRHAKTCGFDSIALDAFEDNVRAHRFYERNGFARHSKQLHEDGVKWRFVMSLVGVAALDRAMPQIQPPNTLTRAWRRLAFGIFTARS